MEVIGREFCDPGPVSLAINKGKDGVFKIEVKDKGDVFTIKDNGRAILLSPAKKTSLPAGETSLTLQHKGTRKEWKVFRTDKELFSVIKKSAQFDVFLAKNKKKEVCDFNIQGNWGEPRCIICRGDSHSAIIAMMDNEKITVYPNVDCAFIVALVAVLKLERDP